TEQDVEYVRLIVHHQQRRSRQGDGRQIVGHTSSLGLARACYTQTACNCTSRRAEPEESLSPASVAARLRMFPDRNEGCSSDSAQRPVSYLIHAFALEAL